MQNINSFSLINFIVKFIIRDFFFINEHDVFFFKIQHDVHL